MNPAKNTPFFNQRKQDKNQNKCQLLALRVLNSYATEENSIGLAIKVHSSLIRVTIDLLKPDLIM